jgi:hypothetical protein
LAVKTAQDFLVLRVRSSRKESSRRVVVVRAGKEGRRWTWWRAWRWTKGRRRRS